MGRIFSAPSAPPPPPLPPEPEPIAPPAPEPAEPAVNAVELGRREADMRRRRGRAAFIATSPRGILAENRQAPTRKTLLGE